MAKDIIHYSCREALEKEGWIITDDPFALKTGGFRMEIDLAAEQVFEAEKESEKILIEVKSFISKSKLNDFYEAKGQYDMYKRGLKREGIERKLYLAIEEDVYYSFFQKTLIAETIREEKIYLIVFNSISKTIIEWIH